MTHDEQKALVRRTEKYARSYSYIWIDWANADLAALLDIIYKLQGEKDRAEWWAWDGMTQGRYPHGDYWTREHWTPEQWTAEAKRKWLEG